MNNNNEFLPKWQLRPSWNHMMRCFMWLCVYYVSMYKNVINVMVTSFIYYLWKDVLKIKVLIKWKGNCWFSRIKPVFQTIFFFKYPPWLFVLFFRVAMMHSDDKIDLVEDGPRFKQGNKKMILLCVLLWAATMVIFIGVGKLFFPFEDVMYDILCRNV